MNEEDVKFYLATLKAYETSMAQGARLEDLHFSLALNYPNMYLILKNQGFFAPWRN